MNKKLCLILCFVLAFALLVMIFCSVNYLSLNKQLMNVRDQVADSQKTWEGIAAEKELLQQDLKTLKNELKEANLSLTESEESAEKLKADIETLQKEIADLEKSRP